MIKITQLRWRTVLAVLWIALINSDSAPVLAQTGPRALKGTLTVIGTGGGSPDDLAVGPDDTIYFGDFKANAVLRLPADSSITTEPEVISPKIDEPEGIVVLPDGTLIVAEQATNRLLRVDPELRTSVLFYDVGNKTKNPGIDGISLDPVSGDVLVPDAPTGRILRISVDKRRAVTIRSGYKRPTSVALAPDGTLYVCDEYGYKIYRVAPNGKQTIIAEMTLPDDVVLDSKGNVFVNSLDGVIWQIDPATKRKTALVVGLKAPHGLALDSHENVIIADATLNQIFRLVLP